MTGRWGDTIKVGVVGAVVVGLTSLVLDRLGVGEIRHALTIGLGFGIARLVETRVQA